MKIRQLHVDPCWLASFRGPVIDDRRRCRLGIPAQLADPGVDRDVPLRELDDPRGVQEVPDEFSGAVRVSFGLCGFASLESPFYGAAGSCRVDRIGVPLGDGERFTSFLVIGEDCEVAV